jgi:hypothetical protein
MRLRNGVFLQLGLAALLLGTSNFRTEALTNIVLNGTLDFNFGGWNFSGPLLKANPTHVLFEGSFSQDLNTVPGRDYIVRFSYSQSKPRLNWGNEMYDTFTNLPSGWNWQTVYRFVHATSAVTRLKFESVTWQVALDDVVVGWLGEPVSIISQPQNRSTPQAGSASFTVGADGGPPLYFQWFLNDEPITGATNHYIVKHAVTPADAGNYHVIVSNISSFVTSAVATLTVDDEPKEPVVVYHPESQELVAGFPHTVRTAAVGSAPLQYQWYFNASEIPGATNFSFSFTPYHTNAGTYLVRVSNAAGWTESLPARLGVYTLTNVDGGYVRVSMLPTATQPEIPIFDVDGVTRLNSNFVAQVYTGRSPEMLRPNGDVLPFRGPLLGVVQGTTVRIPDILPGQLVYGQLKVWEKAAGACYEEARARGGKFGLSQIVSVFAVGVVGSTQTFPFKSFSLRYGLPEFTMGKLELNGRLEDGRVEWVLIGESGFRYLVDRTLGAQNWQPLVILTNETGRITFTDPDQQNSSAQFYRARMLD